MPFSPILHTTQHAAMAAPKMGNLSPLFSPSLPTAATFWPRHTAAQQEASELGPNGAVDSSSPPSKVLCRTLEHGADFLDCFSGVLDRSVQWLLRPCWPRPLPEQKDDPPDSPVWRLHGRLHFQPPFASSPGMRGGLHYLSEALSQRPVKTSQSPSWTSPSSGLSTDS